MSEEKVEATEEMREIIPPVDIYETANDVVLVADIPGMTKEDVTLDIDNDELTISGVFKAPEIEGKKLIDEGIYGGYCRTFVLSNTIDYGKITAKHDNGVLTVTLPKHEKVKPKKIAIETG